MFVPDPGRRFGFCMAALCASLWLAAPWAASAQGATEYRITPSADTTIYAEQSGGSAYDSISDGSGPNLWTAVIAAGVTRRALLRFDLSAIPPGSRVLSASPSLSPSPTNPNEINNLERHFGAYGTTSLQLPAGCRARMHGCLRPARDESARGWGRA